MEVESYKKPQALLWYTVRVQHWGEKLKGGHAQTGAGQKHQEEQVANFYFPPMASIDPSKEAARWEIKIVKLSHELTWINLCLLLDYKSSFSLLRLLTVHPGFRIESAGRGRTQVRTQTSRQNQFCLHGRNNDFTSLSDTLVETFWRHVTSMITADYSMSALGYYAFQLGITISVYFRVIKATES